MKRETGRMISGLAALLLLLPLGCLPVNDAARSREGDRPKSTDVAYPDQLLASAALIGRGEGFSRSEAIARDKAVASAQKDLAEQLRARLRRIADQAGVELQQGELRLLGARQQSLEFEQEQAGSRARVTLSMARADAAASLLASLPAHPTLAARLAETSCLSKLRRIAESSAGPDD